MTNKFVREKHLAELLFSRLGIGASEYLDPNDACGVETGVDVIAIVAQERIGIQVTELDTWREAGKARADATATTQANTVIRPRLPSMLWPSDHCLSPRGTLRWR